MIWRAARYRAGAARSPGHVWRDYVPDAKAPVARVEAALMELGVDFYLPMETEVRRHRRRKETAEIKRRALLPGYIFIADPCNYAAIEASQHILGFVRSGRELVAIRDHEIAQIRQAQADIEAISALRILEITDPNKRRDLQAKIPVGTKGRVKESHFWFAREEVEIMAIKGREYVSAWVKRLQRVVELPLADIDLDGRAA